MFFRAFSDHYFDEPWLENSVLICFTYLYSAWLEHIWVPPFHRAIGTWPTTRDPEPFQDEAQILTKKILTVTKQSCTWKTKEQKHCWISCLKIIMTVMLTAKSLTTNSKLLINIKAIGRSIQFFFCFFFSLSYIKGPFLLFQLLFTEVKLNKLFLRYTRVFGALPIIYLAHKAPLEPQFTQKFDIFIQIATPLSVFKVAFWNFTRT